MDNQAFVEDMASILDVEPSELVAGFQLNSENFDSVAMVGAIAAIDEHYGITVDSKTLAACNSVADMMQVIESKSKS